MLSQTEVSTDKYTIRKTTINIQIFGQTQHFIIQITGKKFPLLDNYQDTIT